MDILFMLHKSNLGVRRYHNGRLQIVRFFPECHPDEYVLRPKDLNTNKQKMIHSALVRQLKTYWKSDMVDDHMLSPDYSCGYQDLPEDLVTELLRQLQEWEDRQ